MGRYGWGDPYERRIQAARNLLDRATELNAPQDALDALCRWIGEMEKHRVNQAMKRARRRL